MFHRYTQEAYLLYSLIQSLTILETNCSAPLFIPLSLIFKSHKVNLANLQTDMLRQKNRFEVIISGNVL